MKPPKPGLSLNIISLTLSKLPPHSVPQIAGALGEAGGITVGEDTFLVPGDFLDWHLFLTNMGGEDIASFKIYSLSAHHGGMDGLQPMVRRLCQRHLKNEIEQLGLEVPNTLES